MRRKKTISDIEREIPNPILAQALTEGTPENEHVFIRGNHKALGKEVDRRLLEAIAGRKPIPTAAEVVVDWN